MSNLVGAKKMYKGDLEIKRSYLGDYMFWGDAVVSGVAEWMMWDFDPFNPLLDADRIVTEVFE